MKIDVVRRGGLAGIPLRGVIDTAELSPEAASQAESAVRGLQFERPPSSPRQPDSFEYEITLLEDSARRSVVLNEAELPDGLRPAIEAAMARGQLG